MKERNLPSRGLVQGALLMLPWLYPFASGPSPSVQQWLLTMACGVLVWLMRAGLKPERVLRAWVAAATISAVIALLQYLGVAHQLAPWVAAAAQGEAYGNLRQRNQFATLCSLGLAALTWLPLVEQNKNKDLQRWTPVLAALLGTVAAASGSRTGLVQMLLLLGLVTLWGLWAASSIRKTLGLAWAAYVISSLALPMLSPDGAASGIWTRWQQEGNTCSSRVALWSNVLELIALKPWLGWGLGELDYAHFVSTYEGLRFCAMLDNAHNLPLQMAVELGVPATVLLCAVAWRWLLRARPWAVQAAGTQIAWTAVLLLLLHSMVEYPLWYGPFQLTLALSFWMLTKRHATGQEILVPGRKRAMECLLGVAVLAALAYAAWDYHRVSQIYLPPEQRAPAYRENTLEKIRGSWLFSDQVRFAEYTITPLTQNNAEQLHAMGLLLLHYSPEARVVEKLIESAVLLGRDEEARFYLARYKAAYPQEHARWAARQQPAAAE